MSSPVPPDSGDKSETLDMGSHSQAEPPDDPGNTLPVGHRLQEYVIEGLVGEGGFGIVYLARDTQLGRVVALKEYMPSSLATRGATFEVSVRSARHRETFQLGLRSFVNEAQLLAAFDHPSLVKVYRFWEQHGTAYMVMPYYQGPTLKQWLIEHDARPDEAWLLSLLHPIMDALELMHHERCYHRDIAPDNILLLSQQATQMGQPLTMRPVLLDFGAARRVISDATQALTVILKSGYAPIEQYAESTSMKQGAWTDVYALSAVLYAAITGQAPLPSVSRMVSDDLVPAAKAGAGHYSPEFLAAIDKGLSVRPEHRPQDMAALRELFGYSPRPGLPPAPPRPSPVTAPRPVAGAVPSSTESDATVMVGQKVAGGGAAAVKLLNPDPAAKSRMPLVVAGFAAVAVLGGAAWWFGRSPGAVGPGPVAQGPASAPVVAATPAPAPDAAPPVAAPVSSPVAPPAAPFAIVTALQDIVRNADPILGVNALADKSVVTIGSDRLQFRVKSSEPGYVYVFFAGTDKSHLYLLFPNAIDQDNRIETNKEMVLPRKGWQITAGGPPGVNHIVTMVSRNPRDLAEAGLRAGKEEIREFDLARVEALWKTRTTRQSPLVGKAQCTAAGACDDSFGATLLTIEEVAKGRAGG